MFLFSQHPILRRGPIWPYLRLAFYKYGSQQFRIGEILNLTSLNWQWSRLPGYRLQPCVTLIAHRCQPGPILSISGLGSCCVCSNQFDGGNIFLLSPDPINPDFESGFGEMAPPLRRWSLSYIFNTTAGYGQRYLFISVWGLSWWCWCGNAVGAKTSESPFCQDDTNPSSVSGKLLYGDRVLHTRRREFETWGFDTSRASP